jgi:hypothetical protein
MALTVSALPRVTLAVRHGCVRVIFGVQQLFPSYLILLSSVVVSCGYHTCNIIITFSYVICVEVCASFYCKDYLCVMDNLCY